MIDFTMASGIAQALSFLDTWTALSVAQQHVPGAALAVVHGDRPAWTKAYGYADVTAKTAATTQTPYRIGSITKTFTALAILQLHEDGKLRLDDRVRDHVTATAIQARNVGLLDVTIRELLTHTSGLQRDLPGTWWSEPSFPERFPDQLSAAYPSGSEWKYSNVGYALLGEVIAATGGEPWARHVERRILGPLAMADTEAMPRCAATRGARPLLVQTRSPAAARAAAAPAEACECRATSSACRR
jgi:D-alanyl-D-alanine carboxypeptidase